MSLWLQSDPSSCIVSMYVWFTSILDCTFSKGSNSIQISSLAPCSQQDSMPCVSGRLKGNKFKTDRKSVFPCIQTCRFDRDSKSSITEQNCHSNVTQVERVRINKPANILSNYQVWSLKTTMLKVTGSTSNSKATIKRNLPVGAVNKQQVMFWQWNIYGSNKHNIHRKNFICQRHIFLQNCVCAFCIKASLSVF